MEDNDDRFAPRGTIWVCSTCGKTARDRYGIVEGQYEDGWDESCMLNAVLIKDENQRSRWETTIVYQFYPFWSNGG